MSASWLWQMTSNAKLGSRRAALRVLALIPLPGIGDVECGSRDYRGILDLG